MTTPFPDFHEFSVHKRHVNFNFKDPFLCDFGNADVYILAYRVQVLGLNIPHYMCVKRVMVYM